MENKDTYRDARMADSDPGDSDVIRKRTHHENSQVWDPQLFYEGSGGRVHSAGLPNVS